MCSEDDSHESQRAGHGFLMLNVKAVQVKHLFALAGSDQTQWLGGIETT
jgi:hypothetical protein